MRRTLAATFLSLMSLPVLATESQAPAFSPLAHLVSETKAVASHPSGTAIVVVQGGRIMYEGYFGFADIEQQIPVDRNTVFYIASATKPFLALNTLLLEDRGVLDSDASLQQLFPAARFSRFDATAVTVRDLLTHTSGVDNQPLVWATAFSGLHDEATRHHLVGASYPNEDAARGTFKYTNVGYNILSVFLDRVARVPWQDQLARNIFEPVGMVRTSAYVSKAEGERWPLARPYSVQSPTKDEPLYLEKADSTMQAAGGMIATAPDLARFLIAQLDEGRIDGRQVLPAHVIAKSHVQQAVTGGAQYEDFDRSGYAWGWYVGEYKGKRMLHHFGGFAGFHAHLSFIPEADIGLVVLNNEDFLATRVTNLVADYVYSTLLHEPEAHTRVARRFEELAAKARQLPAVVEKHQAAIHGRAWQLSLPLPEYAGAYAHPLLGELVVELDGKDQLTLSWGRLRAVATAYNQPDHVRVEFVPNSGQVVEFTTRDGNAVSVEFDGMVFTRVR